ncbi:hypothetical protein BC829DRAFT_186412 [Chytridium lagenaria]|nr:hypothetical protein BC829DRAFT_186412 [Chytridium lagenaria]
MFGGQDADSKRQTLRNELKSEMQKFLSEQSNINPRLKHLRSNDRDVLVSIADPNIGRERGAAKRSECNMPATSLDNYKTSRPTGDAYDRPMQPRIQSSYAHEANPITGMNYDQRVPYQSNMAPMGYSPPPRDNRGYDGVAPGHVEHFSTYMPYPRGDSIGMGYPYPYMQHPNLLPNPFPVFPMPSFGENFNRTGALQTRQHQYPSSYMEDPVTSGGMAGAEGGEGWRDPREAWRPERNGGRRHVAPPDPNADKKNQYLRDLDEQVRQKKFEAERKNAALKAEEKKKEEEIMKYNPWGRSGGGAPNKAAVKEALSGQRPSNDKNIYESFQQTVPKDADFFAALLPTRPSEQHFDHSSHSAIGSSAAPISPSQAGTGAGVKSFARG